MSSLKRTNQTDTQNKTANGQNSVEDDVTSNKNPTKKEENIESLPTQAAQPVQRRRHQNQFLFQDDDDSESEDYDQRTDVGEELIGISNSKEAVVEEEHEGDMEEDDDGGEEDDDEHDDEVDEEEEEQEEVMIIEESVKDTSQDSPKPNIRIEVGDNLLNQVSVLSSIPVPTIQNVVATVDLAARLRLREISDQTLNSEFNPHRFAALIMRIFEPKSTALIFSTGKMVITGAKSAELCRFAAKKFAKIIRKLGYKVQFNNFQIQNIVGSVDLGVSIKLEILAASQIAHTDYEPELFPGLVYRIVEPKIVILVFISGKIVLTGAREVSEIHEAFTKVYPVIQSFTSKSPHEPKSKTNKNRAKRIRAT